jgi:hypothetical protein
LFGSLLVGPSRLAAVSARPRMVGRQASDQQF